MNNTHNIRPILGAGLAVIAVALAASARPASAQTPLLSHPTQARQAFNGWNHDGDRNRDGDRGRDHGRDRDQERERRRVEQERREAERARHEAEVRHAQWLREHRRDRDRRDSYGDRSGRDHQDFYGGQRDGRW